MKIRTTVAIPQVAQDMKKMVDALKAATGGDEYMIKLEIWSFTSEPKMLLWDGADHTRFKSWLDLRVEVERRLRDAKVSRPSKSC